MNLYQTDGKVNVWKKKMTRSAHDPKHTSSSVKKAGDKIMASACMASSMMPLLIFIDDETHEGTSKTNSDIYRNILSCSKTTKEFVGERSGRF